MKSKSDHSSNNKVRIFHDNIVVIGEEWFTDMNLNDDKTFRMAPTKLTKYRINQR